MTKRTDSEVVQKDVALSRMQDPKFLTLTGSPANQVAFKIIRSDQQEATPMAQTDTPTTVRKHRVRSTQQRSSLLFLEFPAETEDSAIEACATEYGIEGYSIETTDAGKKRLCRADSKDIAAVTIGIGNGVVAGVKRADLPATTDPLPGITVVEIDFNKEVFKDSDAVHAFLQRHDIDFLEEGGVKATDKAYTIVRSATEEGADVRTVAVAEGVTARIVRSEDWDIAGDGSIIAFVSEQAYGSYGWGMLDFSAMLADVDLCNATDDATYYFRRTIDNIMFNSGLPIAARKELVARAASQFSAYIGSLLDGLPNQVILVNRSALESKKEAPVSKPEVKPTETPAATGDETPVTRGELKELIRSVLAETGSAATATTPATGDAAPEVDATPSSTETDVQRSDAAPELTATLAALTDQIKRSSEVGQATADALKAMTERVEQMENSTIVRNDSSDNGTVDTTKRKDPFVGVLSGRSKSATTQS